MSRISENIDKIKSSFNGKPVKLIVVTKTRPVEMLQEVYKTGNKIFGENRVQEMVPKFEALTKDIEWHQIGHLQSNKVKYIAPFVSLIHSVDSYGLLEEINKQALKHNRTISCLLQLFIAKEETKYGLDEGEALEILNSPELEKLKNVKITGLMGMATNTDNETIIRQEFRSLRAFFEKIKAIKSENVVVEELSMGMSSDYKIAVEEGSTMVRVGSAVFQ